MKLAKQIPFDLSGDHWFPTQHAEQEAHPMVCDTRLREIFELPKNRRATLYLTINTKQPTSKYLADAYLICQTLSDNMDVAWRVPRSKHWVIELTALSLDLFLHSLPLQTGQIFYLWLETD